MEQIRLKHLIKLLHDIDDLKNKVSNINTDTGYV